MAVHLSGFEELERRFKALQYVAQREVLKKALKKASEVVRDEAKLRAPTDTGELASGITVQIARDTTISEGRVFVGPGKSEFYGRFQEFGTGKSFDAAAARAMGYPGRGSGTGDTRPQPFLRPALEATRAEAEQVMITALQAAIAKAERA